MTDTNKLLLDYAHHGSESAFGELVTRYVDLVYSVALRCASGNVPLAQDITQCVFTQLARKARSLPPHVQLGGWLHRHTCFTASNLRRAEFRRQNREREALQMNSLHCTPDPVWQELSPVLDEAIDQLAAPDREAIVLRYFEQQDLRAVGAALGIGEDAAQKRVSRAVDKLRELVSQRGVKLSVTILGAALASGAVAAAPAGFARKVSATALAAAGTGAGLMGAILALAAATKFKLALAAIIVATAVALPLVLRSSTPVHGGPLAAAETNREFNQIVGLTNTATAAFTNAQAGEPSGAKPKESGLLRLKIVTADSGQPIPNVPLDYRRWDGGRFTGRKLQSTRMGDCAVSFSRETVTELELTTRVDGFADTRLHWRKDRGEEIPAEYTLRLERGTPIGGTVVDADGNPVAGAKVGFNHEDDPTAVKWPVDHEFGWIEVLTDEAGHWRMDRMADELVRRIYGAARHAEQVDSDLISLSGDAEVEKQLRAGRFVFHLGRPVTVSGVVVDSEGNPLADVEVLVGGRSMSGKRTAKSLADGSFTVVGCPPGRQMVTAEAPGYAATTVEVANAGSEPLRLVLQTGVALRLRIVNQLGQPVPEAHVWLDTMHNGPINKPRTIPVQASFAPRSDKHGIVVWSNAPDMELQFDVAASGYQRTNQFKVRPDGAEHVVVMAPAVVVSGQVTDAETGKLIPVFRIITGFPTPNLDGGVTINWSHFGRDWLNFKGGLYRHAFEDALVRGCPDPGYALKFEAEGYASFTSRVINPDEGKVQLDVALQPAAPERYTILLPDGRPAANAEIGLIAPGVRLQLAPGRFNRDQLQVGGSLLMADKGGRFKISADGSVHTVMIAHPQGFLALARAALTGQDYLQLQPWGRLEGLVTSGGNPVAGKEFGLQFNDLSQQDVWFGYTAYHVKSDADGKFVFPQVPPGKLKLLRVVPIYSTPGGGGWSDRPEKEVIILPGQTTQVELGGTGYTVKARVRWPAGFERNTLQHVMGGIHTPMPTWLLEWANDPARRESLEKSPELQAFQKSAKQFEMGAAVDGSLSAENIPAGEYDLSVYAIRQDPQSKTNLPGLGGAVRITVPADPASGTIDAGEVLMTVPREAAQ